MSCTDYQSLIRQWFEDVMETHISKCTSCSEFFLELNHSSIQQIEEQRKTRAAVVPEGSMFPGGTLMSEGIWNLHETLHENSSGTPAPQDRTPTGSSVASSAQSAPPPPMPMMGRLSPGPEFDPATPGLICNIGRFILDERELEMLRSMATQAPSELGLRVLTIKALEDLKSILHDITAHEGVIGWAIIGSDGLLLAGNLPEELNMENLAVRALSIYMGTEEMLERIGNERIQQLVLRTDIGTMYLASFGEGIFVTLSDRTDPDAIVRTLKRIRDVS